jgi:hypothetical protein
MQYLALIKHQTLSNLHFASPLAKQNKTKQKNKMKAIT